MYDDELYDDLDEDIKAKEALLEEAKKLDTNVSWNEVSRDVANLQRRWKQIHDWDSGYEETLNEAFQQCLDVFYDKRKAALGNAKSIKEDLIQQALRLSQSNDWNTATSGMQELMRQWKEAGSASKEIDDTLWESFNEARQTFFDRKNQHWEDQKVKREEALVVKKELIEEAANLSDSENYAKTSDQYRVLMNKWKEAGHAGKEHDDELWNMFQENRQKFYDRREVYYESIRDKQHSVYDVKKDLIAQANAIKELSSYTREHTSKMKELHVAWKQAGTCGKAKDDEIWEEFRSIMDAYFAGLKQHNEQKHANWLKSMMDARNRKQEMINNQKQQIKYMQQEIVGLIGERAISNMEDRIEEIEEFIEELKTQIEEIDTKINGQ